MLNSEGCLGFYGTYKLPAGLSPYSLMFRKMELCTLKRSPCTIVGKFERKTLSVGVCNRPYSLASVFYIIVRQRDRGIYAI